MTEIVNPDRAKLATAAGKGAARAVRRAGTCPRRHLRRQEEPPMLIPSTPKELDARTRTSRRSSPRLLDHRRSAARSIACCRATCSSTRSPTGRCMSTSCASPRTSSIDVNVPVRVPQRSRRRPGLKRGGVLNIVRHEIECALLAGQHPAADRGRPDRPRHRRSRSTSAAVKLPEGRDADHPRSRLHRRHHRARRPWCARPSRKPSCGRCGGCGGSGGGAAGCRRRWLRRLVRSCRRLAPSLRLARLRPRLRLAAARRSKRASRAIRRPGDAC